MKQNMCLLSSTSWMKWKERKDSKKNRAQRKTKSLIPEEDGICLCTKTSSYKVFDTRDWKICYERTRHDVLYSQSPIIWSGISELGQFVEYFSLHVIVSTTSYNADVSSDEIRQWAKQNFVRRWTVWHNRLQYIQPAVPNCYGRPTWHWKNSINKLCKFEGTRKQCILPVVQRSFSTSSNTRSIPLEKLV